MRPAYLSINSQPVDLPASLKGVFRLQNLVAALQELETRTGEYAWPLTLPRSRRNDAVFQQKAHGAALDKFFGAYTFRLQVGGQHWAGVFRLVSLKKGYQGQLIMDGFGWALALGEKKLTDLTSLPAIVYDGIQLESILAQNCDTTDLQFPLISFGNFFGPPRQRVQADGTRKDIPLPASAVLDYPLSVDDYYPSAYYVNVVRAILREAGYFAQGPVLDDADVRTWCITAAGGDQTRWPWGGLLPAAATGTASTPGQNQFSYFASAPAGVSDQYTNTATGFEGNAAVGNIGGRDLTAEVCFLPVPAPLISSGGTRAFDGATSTYTAPRAGSYAFAWSVALASGNQVLNFRPNTIPAQAGITDRFQRVYLALVVRRSGADYSASGLFTSGEPDVLLIPAHDSLTANFDTSEQVIAGTFARQVPVVYLEAGDSVQLCVVFPRRFFDAEAGDFFYRSIFNIGFGNVSFACTHYADNEGYSSIKLSPVALLPPLSQKEVLRDFLVRNNALLTTDAERGIATIDFRDGHRAAQGPPVDLTGLLHPDDYEPLPVLGSSESLAFAPADPNGDALVAAVPVPPALGTINPPVLRPLLPTKGIPAPTYTDAVRIALGSAAAVIGSVKTVQGAFAAIGQRNYLLPSIAISLPTAASADALTTPRSETSWDVAGSTPRVVRYLGLSAVGALLPFQQRSIRFGLADYGGALAWSGAGGAVATRYAESIAIARRGHRLRVPVLLTPTRYRELAPGRRVWVGVAEYTVESITNWDCCAEDSPAQLELLRVV